MHTTMTDLDEMCDLCYGGDWDQMIDDLVHLRGRYSAAPATMWNRHYLRRVTDDLRKIDDNEKKIATTTKKVYV